MWFLWLTLVSMAWARKLDQPLYLPPNAVQSGGHPGDLAPPGSTAPPSSTPEVIPIVSYNFQPNNGDGSYSYSYESANGIRAQEEGVLKNEVPEGPGEAVSGIYSYTGPDGVVYTVAYTADENGFVAKGDHLPTPPPIPPEIQAALAQNAAEEAAQAQQPAPEAAPAYSGYYKTNLEPSYNRPYNLFVRRYK